MKKIFLKISFLFLFLSFGKECPVLEHSISFVNANWNCNYVELKANIFELKFLKSII